MCSVTDFIETSLGPELMLASTATVTGQGAPQVDGSVRGGDFSWPQVGTFVATSGDLAGPRTPKRIRSRSVVAGAGVESPGIDLATEATSKMRFA